MKKMKTKNKVLALLEIAAVLCSVFLVALPAVAAEQTAQEVSATASEDDYVLDIYGNANEDDTIDMRDLTYVKLIFFGKKPETELADAKYDGKINPLDFIQIKLIIVGKEKELTIADSADRIVTVKKPIERIVAVNRNSIEALRSIKAADKIVGVTNSVARDKTYYPKLSECQCIGAVKSPDIEMIIELRPDVVIYYGTQWETSFDKIQSVLQKAGISMIGFDCFKPESIVEDVTKLGYTVGKKEEAKKFGDWYNGVVNLISEKIEKIPEEDKPKIYLEGRTGPYRTCGVGGTTQTIIEMAGGKNIFDDISGCLTIDPEELIDRDPEIIVKRKSKIGGYNLDRDDTTKLEAIREELITRPGLHGVSAVKNEKVYIVSVDIIYGGRYFLGIVYMAKWFHPELLKDINPRAIHQEFVTEFQGLNFDFDEHGVFVYPEPS